MNLALLASVAGCLALSPQLGDAALVTEDGYISFSKTPRELIVAAI